LLGNLQTLAHEIAEDVEDMQSVESVTILGALGSGSEQQKAALRLLAVSKLINHVFGRCFEWVALGGGHSTTYGMVYIDMV